jgi:hypothetical protein
MERHGIRYTVAQKRFECALGEVMSVARYRYRDITANIKRRYAVKLRCITQCGCGMDNSSMGRLKSTESRRWRDMEKIIPKNCQQCTT